MGTTHVSEAPRLEVTTTESSIPQVAVPPQSYPGDAETDLAVLKTIPSKFCVEDENSVMGMNQTRNRMPALSLA